MVLNDVNRNDRFDVINLTEGVLFKALLAQYLPYLILQLGNILLRFPFLDVFYVLFSMVSESCHDALLEAAAVLPVAVLDLLLERHSVPLFVSEDVSVATA